jgi:mono/diheme cytochrome c family protein
MPHILQTTCALAVSLCGVTLAHAQTVASSRPARTGAEIYRTACAACHGADGAGTPQSQLGFSDVEVPDFTDCSFSSPEPAPDWAAVVLRGGPVRAFSRRMPSFEGALTETEIEDVVDYVRSLCTDPKWPRGDLNLPRPLVTEKAFPENESVLTTSISTTPSHAVENELIYEHRLGRRSQYEVIVPFNLQQQASGSWAHGLGDVALALKHALFAHLSSGSIGAVAAEVKLPTGRQRTGLGGGTTVLEGYGAFSQMLPNDGFLHLQGGAEFPLKGDDPDEAFLRIAAGKTVAHPFWGRAWSPMFELIGVQELAGGARREWDVVPQMQVSLSTRQHILFNAGLQIPLGNRSRREKTFHMYLLWDWFDGGFFSGW